MRGILVTVQRPTSTTKSPPFTRDPRFCAQIPTAPLKRGEAIGCAVNSLTGSLTAAIPYTDLATRG